MAEAVLERRKRERRAPRRERRLATQEELRGVDKLEMFLDTIRGRRRGIQIPGHFGNGTFRSRNAR